MEGFAELSSDLFARNESKNSFSSRSELKSYKPKSGQAWMQFNSDTPAELTSKDDSVQVESVTGIGEQMSAWRARAAYLYHKGRWEESLQWFDRALGLVKNSHSAIRMELEESMARCYVKLERFQDAENIAEDMLAKCQNGDHQSFVWNLQRDIFVHSLEKEDSLSISIQTTDKCAYANEPNDKQLQSEKPIECNANESSRVNDLKLMECTKESAQFISLCARKLYRCLLLLLHKNEHNRTFWADLVWCLNDVSSARDVTDSEFTPREYAACARCRARMRAASLCRAAALLDAASDGAEALALRSVERERGRLAALADAEQLSRDDGDADEMRSFMCADVRGSSVQEPTEFTYREEEESRAIRDQISRKLSQSEFDRTMCNFEKRWFAWIYKQCSLCTNGPWFQQ